MGDQESGMDSVDPGLSGDAGVVYLCGTVRQRFQIDD
jgi:hypothetical protein